ncbi:MAG TPA: ABC transporter permease [Vicinamibacterales bacterium]|nr:ABC transporter permease [Vicinamibacterales bacterium]
MSDLFRDVRFAVRLLVKDRWFTAMAVIVLALGIGATNAVFTIVNAVLIRNLPLPRPEQIMFVGTRDTQGRTLGVSLRDFEDWKAASRTFAGLSFIFSGSFNIGDEGLLPEQIPGCYVSANLFKTLGVSPVLGRDFAASEDTPGAPLVVLISDTVWKQRYGGDPAIVGKTIRLSTNPGTIIGVMPDGMHFPFNADVWVPIGTMPAALQQQPRQARGYFAVGRLADGVTVDQARSEMQGIGQRLAALYPTTNRDVWPRPDPFLERVLGSQIQRLFWSLLGAVGFVVLIACSNVANLLLARAARRSGEMSVRIAVGGSRWQIVRQLLVESVLLAFVAGGLGLLLSIVGIRWFAAEAQNVGVPYWMVFAMDWRTFSVLLVLCLATGVLFGLAPALHASKTNVHEMLKEGGRTGSGGGLVRRWTAGLIVVQVALTLVLLAGGGLLLRSFLTMYRMDIGIQTARLITSSMIIPARKYPGWEDRTRFLQAIDDRFGSTAGIDVASTATSIPLGGGAARRIEVDGRAAVPGDRVPEVTMLSVGSRYFDVLGLPLLRGRAFTNADGEPGRLVAIVNQRLATIYFRDQDPIGRTIRLSQDTAGNQDADWLTVVGLVPNVRQRNNNQEREPDPVAYLPHRENTGMARAATVLARTRTTPAQATRLLREAMMTIDPDQALANPLMMDDALAQQRWLLRVFTTMFGVFAAIALVLAAVGLYAVTAYAVTQHTRDIGVRMVLGARPLGVIWYFLRRSLVQLAIGAAAGLAAAVAVGRVLQSFLVQTSAHDPLTLGAIVALLAAVAMTACVVPAWRAARLDPLAAIRHD